MALLTLEWSDMAVATHGKQERLVYETTDHASEEKTTLASQ